MFLMPLGGTVDLHEWCSCTTLRQCLAASASPHPNAPLLAATNWPRLQAALPPVLQHGVPRSAQAETDGCKDKIVDSTPCLFRVHRALRVAVQVAGEPKADDLRGDELADPLHRQLPVV